MGLNLPAALGESVTLYGPPSGFDDYGDLLASVGDIPVVVDGCAVAPVSSDRVPAGTLASITDQQMDIYLPAGVDLIGVARVEMRGQVWEPVGFPGLWRSPFDGTEPGQVLTVRAVTS